MAADRVGQGHVILRFSIKGISPVGLESGHIRQGHAITRWPLGQVRLYIMYLVVGIIQVDNGPSVTKGNLHPISRFIHIS